MGKVAVIDYGMGNLHSVCKALEFVGADAHIVKEPVNTDEYERMVLPGVGALGDCMKGLQTRKLDELVLSWIREDRPFLGVCLGLQALFDYSEEYETKGLGVLAGKVSRFELPQPFKIPHMGWNSVSFSKRNGVMDEVISSADFQFYFDHSYYVKPENSAIEWGVSDHGGSFVCAVNYQNCYAVQFHPEKSQAIGLQIYKNFMRL